MVEFEPDQGTLDLLRSEYEHIWIGPKLLAAADGIRRSGGSEQDYLRWVLASNLWLTYEGNTRASATARKRNLTGAWDRAERSEPFELDEALAKLIERIASSRWVGRSGSRNRAVALAFAEFCRDHNCFTRTISCYELSKHTAGISPSTVNKALADLVNLGLLSRVERTDKRTSNRSTSRYKLNLRWNTEACSLLRPSGLSQKSVSDTRSTDKDSLSRLRSNTGDLWSSRGLGQTAGRVYEALADVPATVAELSDRAGLSQQQTRRAAGRLFDHSLAGEMPGKPVRYFKTETPLGLVEDQLGCAGYVEYVISRTEQRQAVNRLGYPGSYR